MKTVPSSPRVNAIVQGRECDDSGADLRAVPILVYHEISRESHPSFGKYVVSPGAFARQMQFLRSCGYTPIALDAILAARSHGMPLPRSPVVITFDDGFRDSARYAADVLERHRFPAVFFLVAGLVGQTSRWLEREGKPARALADWKAARALLAAGFTCGAHSLTHPRLSTLSEAECRHELQVSRSILEGGLGRQVTHLAYPFGSFNERVLRVVAEVGYQTACTVEIGKSTARNHLLALPRIPIIGADTIADFASRLHTGRSMKDWSGAVKRRLWRTFPGSRSS